jgi:Icc protein
MNRRNFLRLMGWGLAATWATGGLSWPRAALAGMGNELRLALLADAHLKDGDDRRAEARRLARAVAEIRALQPLPDLMLFAGDLAHRGDPRALALGREILSDLPAPLFMVMGEGDGLADDALWRRFFGDPWFSHSFTAPPKQGFLIQPAGRAANLGLSLLPPTANPEGQASLRVLGLHTSWGSGPGGPGFYVGEQGRRWLARELARLNPDTPLLVLSHAPLTLVFRPWQQWTGDAPEVAALLSPFRHVLCVHGHVHLPGVWDQRPGVRELHDLMRGGFTGNRRPGTANCLCHRGLPATAWPRPLALQGTPAVPGPGLGPRGCGWTLASLKPPNLQLQPRLWQA